MVLVRDAETLIRRPRGSQRTPAWRTRALYTASETWSADDERSLSCDTVETEDGPTDVLFGRFRLLGLCGTGGVCEVFAAHDRLTDTAVALKRLRPGFRAMPRARDWLVEEARLTQRFAHPGVVRIHGVGEHLRELFLTMEYVHGRSLASALDALGPLPLADLLSVGRLLANALDHVHGNGVVHCDVKPDNVIVGAEGRVVLVDFGVAQQCGGATHRGGTPQYMAPEQMGGRSIEPRTDVFGLGALLNAACVGPSIVEPTVWDPPVRVHPGLARLVVRCLAPCASDRPTMREVERTLAGLHRELVPEPARRWAS